MYHFAVGQGYEYLYTCYYWGNIAWLDFLPQIYFWVVNIDTKVRWLWPTFLCSPLVQKYVGCGPPKHCLSSPSTFYQLYLPQSTLQFLIPHELQIFHISHATRNYYYHYYYYYSWYEKPVFPFAELGCSDLCSFDISGFYLHETSCCCYHFL